MKFILNSIIDAHKLENSSKVLDSKTVSSQYMDSLFPVRKYNIEENVKPFGPIKGLGLGYLT